MHESRVGADLPLKPPTSTSSLPPAPVQSSSHPGWPESHLKLWNCIPFSSPINSIAVSKTNGGFRKSILMKEKEKEQGKDTYLRGGCKRREGVPRKVAMKEMKKKKRGKERERQRRNACACLLNVCVELCVCCVMLSPVTRVGEGYTGLI